MEFIKFVRFNPKSPLACIQSVYTNVSFRKNESNYTIPLHVFISSFTFRCSHLQLVPFLRSSSKAAWFCWSKASWTRKTSCLLPISYPTLSVVTNGPLDGLLMTSWALHPQKKIPGINCKSNAIEVEYITQGNWSIHLRFSRLYFQRAWQMTIGGILTPLTRSYQNTAKICMWCLYSFISVLVLCSSVFDCVYCSDFLLSSVFLLNTPRACISEWIEYAGTLTPGSWGSRLRRELDGLLSSSTVLDLQTLLHVFQT